MSRSSANDDFAKTSFLFGGNATFIEQLYAQYQRDPTSVDQEWQDFFSNLKDDTAQVVQSADGPSWQRKDWPVQENGELVSALDSDWSALETDLKPKIEKRSESAAGGRTEDELRAATIDSIRAIMMIRAYRMRGHLDADLDPLKLDDKGPSPELKPEAFGFAEGDMDRPIFIDNVLGMEIATVREILRVLRRTYCSTIGVEFLHISDPAAKRWLQERIEGPDKEITFTPQGKKAILRKLVETEGLEKFIDVK